MTIILDNLEPEVIKTLQVMANAHGRSLREEIKVILMTETQKNREDIRYNAWGKVVTRESSQKAINEMRELRKSIALDKSTIQEMREEGRRF
jgi:plasmid stability protein